MEVSGELNAQTKPKKTAGCKAQEQTKSDHNSKVVQPITRSLYQYAIMVTIQTGAHLIISEIFSQFLTKDTYRFIFQQGQS
jgi:hypothetical protein